MRRSSSAALAATTRVVFYGLEAPDDLTLVVHLTKPVGDLGVRFAMPATAPIPPGAADGHANGYGPYLAASGPYMIEQYVAGQSVTLARNPSWDATTDDLREAYADRIEIAISSSTTLPLTRSCDATWTAPS